MRTAMLAFLISGTYATARYNVFKGVPWSDWPTYTVNKAFGLSALLVLVIHIIRKRLAQGRSTDQTLRWAGAFAAMHVVLSLTLLSPAYYEKLFLQGKLTAAANWSMLLGAVAALGMASGALTLRDKSADGGAVSLAILAFVIGLHATLQGFAGWFAPLKWPGMMPPISLISFLLGLAAAVVALCPKRSA